MLPVIGPAVLIIINLSLTCDYVSNQFKRACVLNLALYFEYTGGKNIAEQLLQDFEGNNISDTFESGFRHKHSNEDFLWRAMEDILAHTDRGETLINRLKTWTSP